MFKFATLRLSALLRRSHGWSVRCSRLAIDQTPPLLTENCRWPSMLFAGRPYSKGQAIPEADAETEVASICSELCHANRWTFIDANSCEEIVTLLLSMQYNKSYVKRVFSENPVLLKYPLDVWKETASKLKTFGFHERQLLPLLAACQSFLDGNYWDKLSEAMMFLHRLDIPYRQRLELVTRNPALMELTDAKAILNTYSNILRAFTKTEALKLIVNSPNVLTDQWEVTSRKMNYIYQNMGMRSREIVKSHVFEHSLSHIITRHLFAWRAGVYKTPDKHEISAKEDNRQTLLACPNPYLSELVDTIDRKFAVTVCRLSLPEYKAFALMMAEELERRDDSDSDDLTDSDSESE